MTESTPPNEQKPRPTYATKAPKLPPGATFQPSRALSDKTTDAGKPMVEISTRVNPLRRKMKELERQGYTRKQVKEIERQERKALERLAKAPRATCPSCGYEGPVLDGKCDSCQAPLTGGAAASTPEDQ